MGLFDYDGCINTYTGLKFSFADPKPEQIDILDIAKGLAYRGHFGGQTDQFFSIAQHSILVANLMPASFRYNPEILLAALLHDATEAYTGDMVKPLKLMLPEFKVIEDRITAVIFSKFDIDIKLLEKVKPYDKKAQELEYSVFFIKKAYFLNYLKPEEAQAEFMHYYINLMEKI